MPAMSRRSAQLALLTDDLLQAYLAGRTTWRAMRGMGIDDYRLVRARLADMLRNEAELPSRDDAPMSARAR